MFEAADPGDDAFEAVSEAAVWYGAVATEVQVPLEGIQREIVVFDSLEEGFVVVFALAAADDFAVAFWS